MNDMTTPQIIYDALLGAVGVCVIAALVAAPAIGGLVGLLLVFASMYVLSANL